MSESLLDLIRARRTVRAFTAEPITNEQLDALLEAAMYAPTRLNRQPWRFVVLRDQHIKNEIAEALRVRPYIEQADTLIVAAADTTLSPVWLMDVSAAIENMLLAATALGLGGAWVGAPDTVIWTMMEERLRDWLRIPAEVRPVALVALGHPAETPDPHTADERFDRTKIHYGAWGQRRF
jgi:nitroreductase